MCCSIYLVLCCKANESAFTLVLGEQYLSPYNIIIHRKLSIACTFTCLCRNLILWAL